MSRKIHISIEIISRTEAPETPLKSRLCEALEDVKVRIVPSDKPAYKIRKSKLPAPKKWVIVDV